MGRKIITEKDAGMERTNTENVARGGPQIIKNHEQIDAKVFKDIGTRWVRSGGVHIATLGSHSVDFGCNFDSTGFR
jgi:hypothetical protein